MAKHLLEEHAHLNIYDPKVAEVTVLNDLKNVVPEQLGIVFLDLLNIVENTRDMYINFSGRPCKSARLAVCHVFITNIKKY